MEGPWKLVLQKYDGNRWQPELYNRAVDSEEQRPVDDPERTSTMHAALLDWVSDHSDSKEMTIELDEETLEHLKALGYGN